MITVNRNSSRKNIWVRTESVDNDNLLIVDVQTLNTDSGAPTSLAGVWRSRAWRRRNGPCTGTWSRPTGTSTTRSSVRTTSHSSHLIIIHSQTTPPGPSRQSWVIFPWGRGLTRRKEISEPQVSPQYYPDLVSPLLTFSGGNSTDYQGPVKPLSPGSQDIFTESYPLDLLQSRSNKRNRPQTRTASSGLFGRTPWAASLMGGRRMRRRRRVEGNLIQRMRVGILSWVK